MTVPLHQHAKGRLLFLAWGDEHNYDIGCSRIALYGG